MHIEDDSDKEDMFIENQCGYKIHIHLFYKKIFFALFTYRRSLFYS